jgi:hypothetical protein
MAAFQFFARLGVQAKPHVVVVLKYASDPDPNIRAAVLAVVFAAQASAENAGAIRPLRNDSRSDVRVAAAKCLGQAGKAAEVHLAFRLMRLRPRQSGSGAAAAPRACANRRADRRDIDAIVPLIGDRDAEVRTLRASTLSGLVMQRQRARPMKDKSVRDAGRAIQNEPPEIKAAIIEDIERTKRPSRPPSPHS